MVIEPGSSDAEERRSFRIAAGIGGTFTDLALSDGASGLHTPVGCSRRACRCGSRSTPGPGQLRRRALSRRLGLVRSYRLLTEEAVLQLRSDRRRFRPYGLAGGAPAAASQNSLLEESGAARSLPSKVTMTIRRGDLVRHVQPGGGGHGDPLARDCDLIERDLADGKTNRGYAESRHGVIVDPATLTIDRAASLRRRSELRQAAAKR